MGLAGAKPKADRSQVRHRNPVAEWTEVENVPYDGPPLPARRDELSAVDEVIMSVRNEVRIVDNGWPTPTLRWWEAVRTMPHAALWSATDWQFAFLTAEVHARFIEGWKGYTGAELRQRERFMGVYYDARRDLRIRYVEPKPKTEETPAGVARLDDYRGL